MLTSEQVDRYRQDGYLVPLPALSSDEVVGSRDSGGHFDLLPSPEGELRRAELERHERVYRRYRENYAEQTEWHERRFPAA